MNFRLSVNRKFKSKLFVATNPDNLREELEWATIFARIATQKQEGGSKALNFLSAVYFPPITIEFCDVVQNDEGGFIDVWQDMGTLPERTKRINAYTDETIQQNPSDIEIIRKNYMRFWQAAMKINSYKATALNQQPQSIFDDQMRNMYEPITCSAEDGEFDFDDLMRDLDGCDKDIFNDE